MIFNKKLKRNLTLLITLVGLSYSSFSQTGTKTTSTVKRDSAVVLITPIAKLVVKDLISGDQFKKELLTTRDLLEQTNSKLQTQTLLVTNLEGQVNNYEGIIKDMQEKYNVQSSLSQELEKALKKQKRTTFLYKVGTTVGAVAVGLLLIQ